MPKVNPYEKQLKLIDAWVLIQEKFRVLRWYICG